MALTTCRECGREVSTGAATCPHCGAANPAGKARPDTVVDDRIAVDDRVVVVRRGGMFPRFLLWIILIMFVVVAVAWFMGLIQF